MLNKIKILYGLFTIICAYSIVACGNGGGNEYKCQETRIISDFPVNINLDKGHLLPVNPYGCVDFIGVDSLVIFKIYNGDYLWNVVNLNNTEAKCNLFSLGHGENEFTALPISERAFVTDSALYCDFYSPEQNTFYRCNLSKSFDLHSPCLEIKEDVGSFETFQTLYRLQDNTFFAVRYIGHNGYSRGILNRDGFIECDGLGNLNKMTVEENINTLSSVRCVNQSVNTVVEAMIRMHQINLYSISDGKSLTLSVDGELQDAKEIDQTSKSLLKKGFGNVSCYDDYFMAVYVNSSLVDFLKASEGQSQLLVFDWDGVPLARISLPHMAANAYIYDNHLFVLTTDGDFYQYDKPAIM